MDDQDRACNILEEALRLCLQAGVSGDEVYHIVDGVMIGWAKYGRVRPGAVLEHARRIGDLARTDWVEDTRELKEA